MNEIKLYIARMEQRADDFRTLRINLDDLATTNYEIEYCDFMADLYDNLVKYTTGIWLKGNIL